MNQFEEMAQKFEEMIAKEGWAAHYVFGDEHHINYHTHGVHQNYGHLDLQICLPMSSANAHGITNLVIEAIKKGEKFTEGQEHRGILGNNHKMGFKVYQECGRDVLRLLFPDAKGYLPTEKACDPKFKRQLDVLND